MILTLFYFIFIHLSSILPLSTAETALLLIKLDGSKFDPVIFDISPRRFAAAA